MRIKSDLSRLTIGQLMVLLPDNDSLFHDSGVWNIAIDHQDAVSYDNEDLRLLLIDRISDYEYTDEVEIGCLMDSALSIKEILT